MPFASNGSISHDPIEGGIEITEAQYAEALDGMLAGLVVRIDGGFSVSAPEAPPTPEKTPDEINAEAREALKRERADLVAAIKVSVGGLEFDGDEESQGRMARAILGMQTQPEGSTVQWVLSDNSVVAVGITELSEALTLAGLRQTELWVQA